MSKARDDKRLAEAVRVLEDGCFSMVISDRCVNAAEEAATAREADAARDELFAAVDALIAERDAAVARLDALTLPDAARRERIAAAALTGALASDANPSPTCTPCYLDLPGTARFAVSCADALIAALDAPKETP